MKKDDGLKKGLGRYTAIYTPAEEGGWLVHASELPRCRTEGDSIEEARANIREALGLFYADAATAEIIDSFALPKTVELARVTAKETRQEANKAAELASAATSKLVVILRKEMGLSTRDAAAIAGLSQQRVAALAPSLRRSKKTRQPASR